MKPTLFADPGIAAAIDAVRRAARLARTIERELVSPALAKDDRSPVTVADFAVQACIAHALAVADPDRPLIGEECAAALREEAEQGTLDEITRFVNVEVTGATVQQTLELIDRGAGEPGDDFWTLDPIDGTKGFLRGDQYAVALGRVCGGQVEMGVLACPQLAEGRETRRDGAGTLMVAVRGEGAWMQPIEAVEGDDPWRRLQVSGRSQISEARLLRSVESAHTNTGAIGELVKLLGIDVPPVPLDSQAKYAVLAAGHGDVLVRLLSASRPDYREQIWDQAAGSIIVEEAGGRVSDLDGKRLDFSHGRSLAQNRGVLATNGLLHDSVLGALRALGA